MWIWACQPCAECNLALTHCWVQNKTHALNDEMVVNALAGVVGVGITYIKDDEDIVPLLKARFCHSEAVLSSVRDCNEDQDSAQSRQQP